MAGSNNGPGHNYLSRRAVIKHLLYDCRGHALEQQSSMNLVSNQDLSDCPGGACVGIVSKAGYTPPLTVLFVHLPGQIVLSEPL